MKDNMHPLRKLTSEENEYISSNYKEIRKKIKEIISNRKGKFQKLIHGKLKDAINEVISHIPEAVVEWNPEKAKTMGRVDFIAYRAVLRLIDEYRKNNKSRGISNNKKTIIKSAIERVLARKGYLNEGDIEQELIDNGYDPESFKNTRLFDIISLERKDKNFLKDFSILNYIAVQNNDLNDMEWEDFKTNLIEKSNIYFNNSDANIYKAIIKDYLIPKASGLEFTSIVDLSKELDTKKLSIYNKLTGENMRNFAESIIK